MERAVWAVANVQQSLEKKQQQQDEINDTFDKLAARQEERRVGLVGRGPGEAGQTGEPAGQAADQPGVSTGPAAS